MGNTLKFRQTTSLRPPPLGKRVPVRDDVEANRKERDGFQPETPFARVTAGQALGLICGTLTSAGTGSVPWFPLSHGSQADHIRVLDRKTNGAVPLSWADCG